MAEIAKKYIRDFWCGYIYQDGTCVIIHEEKIRGSIEVEYATIHLGAFNVHRGLGRLVVHSKEAFALLCASRWVGWQEASLANGSELTKQNDINVGNVYVDFGFGETWIHLFPDLISSDYMVQDAATLECWEKYPVGSQWGTVTVTEVKEAKA